MTKKIIICLVLIGVGLFFLLYLYPFIKQERRARKAFTLCQTLKIGMTVEEMGMIMGTPSRIKKNDDPTKTSDEGDEYYRFPSLLTASHPTEIEIKDGKIIRTICGGIYTPPYASPQK